MVGWLDVSMVAWLVGWMVGWMDGWLDGCGVGGRKVSTNGRTKLFKILLLPFSSGSFKAVILNLMLSRRSKEIGKK